MKPLIRFEWNVGFVGSAEPSFELLFGFLCSRFHFLHPVPHFLDIHGGFFRALLGFSALKVRDGSPAQQIVPRFVDQLSPGGGRRVLVLVWVRLQHASLVCLENVVASEVPGESKCPYSMDEVHDRLSVCQRLQISSNLVRWLKTNKGGNGLGSLACARPESDGAAMPVDGADQQTTHRRM